MPHVAEAVSPSIARHLFLLFRNRKQLHPIMLAQEQQAMVARFSMLQQQNYNAVRRKKKLARLEQRLADKKRQEEMIREWTETFKTIATWGATAGAKNNKRQREQTEVEESVDSMSISRLKLYSYLTAKFGGPHGSKAEKSRNRSKSRSLGRTVSRMKSDNSNPSSYKGGVANKRRTSSSDGSFSSSGSESHGVCDSDSGDSDSDMSTSHMGSGIVCGLSST